jgi:hypothetical protein
MFKSATYKKALVGGFASVAELRTVVLRDLTNLVRQLAARKRLSGTMKKIEVEEKLTEVLILQRKHKIPREAVKQLREELLGNRSRTKAQMVDPVEPGQKGPNGYPIGYTKDGDKVEFVPDYDNLGEVWPLLLRRNDKIILEAYKDFWDVIWWMRNTTRAEQEQVPSAIRSKRYKKFLQKHFPRVQRVKHKYGLNNLNKMFEWGMLSGRMSALSWVMGSEWEESLDT